MKGKAPRTKGAQEPPPGYNESAIVIYETPGGVRVDVNLGKETVLLNLNRCRSSLTGTNPLFQAICERMRYGRHAAKAAGQTAWGHRLGFPVTPGSPMEFFYSPQAFLPLQRSRF
jgi:hypothetical protein